jgi:hypothetical protein
MKKYIIALSVLALMFAVTAQADTIVCPAGQEVKSVLVTEAIIGTPAVTHIVSHEAVTHEVTIIDTPAYSSYVYVGLGHGDYLKIGRNYIKTLFGHGDYDKVNHPAVTHTETVIDTPAWDEVVIDVPEVIATPAVYEDQCVDMPVVVTESATAPVVSSGSHSGGYMSPCMYIKVFSDMPCVWSQELATKFGTDQDFRESILIPWRTIIFGK